MDITEAAVPLVTPAAIGDRAQLLAIKDAAKYLGISYSALYELVNTAEISHVAVGNRKYISRDALKAFIESHTRLGYHGRDA